MAQQNQPLSSTALLELTIVSAILIGIGALTPPDQIGWYGKYIVCILGIIGAAIRVGIGLKSGT